jgi:hypothetical protein
MKSIGFTLEESQLIIEALLFTASVDVCSDHTEVQRAKMVELAGVLNNKFDKPRLNNVYIFNEDVPECETTLKIINSFSNIPLQDIIKD